MGTSRTDRGKSVVIAAEEGESLEFAGVRAALKIDGSDSGERFAVAHFPAIPPHVLAAALPRHHNEDEYLCVLEGALSVQLGEDIVTAGAGTWLIKPRGQWHTFWNASDTPCRTSEIVSPAGFQRYFKEVAAIGPDWDRLARLNVKHGLDMDFDSVPRLCKRFGLHFGVAVEH